MENPNNIKRISEDEVIEAYKKTGIKPIRGEWHIVLNNEHFCCPLATLVAMHNPDMVFKDQLGSTEEFADALGLDYDYVLGFITHFDHDDIGKERETNNINHRIGLYDGKSVYKALVDEGLID